MTQDVKRGRGGQSRLEEEPISTVWESTETSNVYPLTTELLGSQDVN